MSKKQDKEKDTAKGRLRLLLYPARLDGVEAGVAVARVVEPVAPVAPVAQVEDGVVVVASLVVAVEPVARVEAAEAAARPKQAVARGAAQPAAREEACLQEVQVQVTLILPSIIIGQFAISLTFCQ